MFSRRKGLFIITTVALLAVASLVRVGQAQKSPPVKTSPGGHAQLKSSVATVGRAVGFAETRPVREIMDQIDQVDRELLKAGREINELNSGFVRIPNANAPVQKDGALQSSFGPDGRSS